MQARKAYNDAWDIAEQAFLDLKIAQKVCNDALQAFHDAWINLNKKERQ